MTRADYCKRLNELSFNSCRNIRYYQAMTSRFLWRDRGIRIALGVLTAIGFGLAIPTMGDGWIGGVGFVTAALSMAAALVLNVIPVADWAKDKGELFRLWSDLQKDLSGELLKANDPDEDKAVSPAKAGRLKELNDKAETLHALDSHTDDKLWKECRRLEMIARFGVATNQEVESQRSEPAKRRKRAGAACFPKRPMKGQLSSRAGQSNAPI